jgi:metal transporter CNNM
MASSITSLSAMIDDNSILANAAEALASIGATALCHPSSHDFAPFFPQCEKVKLYPAEWRDLAEDLLGEGAEEDWFYLRNGLLATLCVVVAALAAGLTMGLMSLDPLMLHIKQRAGATEQERQQAAALLPVVKKHHLLLVTLLLLNALANEALPLFLDKLVPNPVLTIICSVTLVLFFGEIIPSAVFTGPNQLQIAARLIPLVNIAITLLLPIAYPIAKLLDWLLHDEDDTSNIYNRGELSALVRIHYEEHLATKRRHRAERTKVTQEEVKPQNVAKAMLNASIREAKRELQHAEIRSNNSNVTEASAPSTYQRSPSIHFDEVSMVEGALSMKTKMAVDVYTPLRKIFAIPYDT